MSFRPINSKWLAIALTCGFAATAMAQNDFTSTRGLGDVRDESLLGPEINRDPLKHCKLTIIREISVPAEEAGVLDTLNVKEGQHVEVGEVLASIDKTDAELAILIATHEYAAAKLTAENTLSIQAASAAFEVSKAELQGSQDANNKSAGTVTKTEVRRQGLQAKRAKLQAELATHELKVSNLDARAKYKAWQRAEAALKRRDIMCRINGVVVNLNKHEGDWVQPGETVMRVVQMDRLRVEGDVDGRVHARHEILGRPVRIKVTLTGGGEELLEGKIVYASSIVDSNEYTVRAEIDNRKLPNGAWLMTPGLDAEIELIGEGGGALDFGNF